MALPVKSQFVQLPRWATVAFIARCARRVLPLYRDDPFEPAEQRLAVAQAIRLAEQRAGAGGEPGPMGDALKLGDQYFDNYDYDALSNTLAGCVNAASNTHDDVGEEAKLILAVTSLAHAAFDAAFSAELSAPPVALSELAENAAGWAVFPRKGAEPQVLRDFETIRARAAAEAWTDLTPVPPSVFGMLWPEGLPEGWPPAALSFRPQARIIRTIGDRLISGPEAAVIELIKNSHDADASFARITFAPPLRQDGGFILVEDDGHGMTLADIEQKWMEPATSDKRDRKISPKGRQLLGSKGIGRFASARLGRFLELISSGVISSQGSSSDQPVIQTTRIPRLDWNEFDEGRYLEDIRFPVESQKPAATTGTTLKVSALRDDWSELRMRRLHEELRRLVSPIQKPGQTPFRIFLDLSQCTIESCGFDGAAIVNVDAAPAESPAPTNILPFQVRPFPVLEASDYAVDGAFDETGVFEGTMTVRRGGLEPERIKLQVPIHPEQGEEPCGIVLVRFHIFDREAMAVRSTAEKAGFGAIGVREARKLLDSISGVAIYREGFRVRPYGDGQNDWLTLDAKRVQNPSIKIGRNQIAGVVVIDGEQASNLVERSSREGLEENGSFRRLNSLVSTLLAEVIEPRRRQFRVSAGLESRNETGFQEIFRKVQMGWSKLLVAKIPEPDRAAAEALIAKESDRLTAYLKKLEERQAQLEAQVTMGLIVGEVMHQGNTPLSFLETETARLLRWWPGLLSDTPEAGEDRQEVPRLLNGMTASSGKLRVLFNALSPLSGARRGQPKPYDAAAVIAQTQYLFANRMQKLGIVFRMLPDESGRKVFGYPDDLATAVTNLFDNAIYWLEHHGVVHPEISVTLQAEGMRCLIVVADNGRGVPVEFAEQVFDVGFTLKPSGTGLGLSIAKEAVLRSSGELQLLASATGAAFQIALPYESAPVTDSVPVTT